MSEPVDVVAAGREAAIAALKKLDAMTRLVKLQKIMEGDPDYAALAVLVGLDLELVADMDGQSIHEAIGVRVHDLMVAAGFPTTNNQGDNK